MEALEHALALGRGDARAVVARRRTGPGPARPVDARGARARCPVRCARSRCARGCAAPARAGRGRRSARPSGTGPSSNRRSAVRLTPSHRSATNGRSSIGSVRRKSVCSAWASTSRSSTSRLIRVISACTSRSTRRTSSSVGILLRGEHLELAADHGQRRAQLVGGVGDELALAAERLREPVEHVVERLRRGPATSLPSGPATVHPRLEIAGVDPSGDRGHPPQRRRHPGTGEVGREQRERQRQRAGEHERARDAVLRAVRRSRAARRRRRSRRSCPSGYVFARGSGPGRRPARAGSSSRSSAPSSARAGLVLPACSVAVSPSSGGIGSEQLRVVAGRRCAWHEREQQRRGRAVRLRAGVRSRPQRRSPRRSGRPAGATIPRAGWCRRQGRGRS